MFVNLRHRFRRFLDFFTLLTVEPVLFILVFTIQMKETPTNQLTQDKYCLQKYHAPPDYCYRLPQMKAEDDYLDIKSSVLTDLTQFTNYYTLLTVIPAVVTALFIGSWCDAYLPAKKVLMSAGAIGGIAEALMLVLNVYFFDITGGWLAAVTAIHAYIAATTPPRLRSLRLMIVELVVFVAAPIATYVSGKVLNMSPVIGEQGQLHNYAMVFIIGGSANLLCLAWIVFAANEKRDLKEFERRFGTTSEDTDTNDCGDVVIVSKEVTEEKTQSSEPIDTKAVHPLKSLFNWRNVVDMCRTCFKRRANCVRAQIWLLFLSMFCYLTVHVGLGVFLYPFVQKVYEWNSETYSNVTAIGYVITALSNLIATPILIKVFNVKDTTLAIIGLLSYFVQNMIRGLVLNENGYYIALVVGGMGSLSSVGIRTYLSKIVAKEELGKVFCFVSAMDSVAPAMASLFFTNVFNATMDSMPGISFVVVAGIMIPPVIVMIWIDLYTSRQQRLINDDNAVDGELKANHNRTNV